MLEDKCNILKLIKNNQSNFSPDNIVDWLIEGFKSELMSQNDEKLIKMAFSKNPTQQQLDDILKDWDIEVKGSAKSLMLSYFMKLYPNLYYPDYVGP